MPFKINPMWAAAGAAFLLLGTHSIWCELELSERDVLIAGQQSQIVALKSSKANLQDALDRQNDAVDELVQESADRSERAAQALQHALIENADLEEQLARIRDSPSTGAPCKDANLLINRVFEL